MSKKLDNKESDNKEPENIESIIISIRGTKYKLPEQLEYEQYYLVSKLIDESNIDFTKFFNFSKGKSDNLKIGMEVMKFLNDLIKVDILPKFFSLILLPLKDGIIVEFDSEKAEQYESDMRKLTDLDIVNVAQSFFVGRGILMGGGLNVLQGFKTMKAN